VPATIVRPSPDDLQTATDLLKSLIQVDTSNPPGNVRELIDLLTWQCTREGLTPTVVGPDQDHPNLVTRLAANPSYRKARPLILSCHLDTVPADPERWTHPPFSAHEENGYIWGRGAIDMKGFAAMAFTVLRLIKRSRIPINRDIIFAAVSDEETGTDHGSDWLVNERPDLLGTDPEYVINEVGGFTVHQNGERFYPVQVAEKGICWMKLTIKGKSGHSSLPGGENSVALLAEAITKISKARLPWHPNKPARRFLDGFAEPSGSFAKRVVPLLLNRIIGPALLPLAIRDKSRRASVEALLRNTATPTKLSSGPSINVLPGEASVMIDGRLTPGQKAKYLVAEVRRALGDPDRTKYQIEIVKESPAVEFTTDTTLYEHIKDVMKVRDPGCHLVPSIIPGFTDSKNYARLGATCYGFYPLKLSEEVDFASLFHGDDERIPVDGYHWGIETLLHLLSRFLTG